jgi:hypothetical protein
MCTLTNISALAAAGGSPEQGLPSRLVMQLSPIDVKFSPAEMSLLMQLAGACHIIHFFTSACCCFSFLFCLAFAC